MRARVGLGRLDEIGAALRDAFEHRAHDLRPAAPAGEPEQRAARAVVPLRRAEAEQRGHVHHAAGVGALLRDLVALRPTSARMPRSSRSHSTLVPAESMIASRPQVSTPSRRIVTIGNVPPPPRVSNVGPVGPTHEVEHAAGAERDLGRTRRATHPCPTSDACWSPISAAIGGAPGSAVAVPTIPLVSTTVGQHALGDAQRLERAPDASPDRRPVRIDGDRGVARVGDVQRALGEGPRDPGVDRAEAQVAGPVGIERCRAGSRSWWPTTFGAKRNPAGLMVEAVDDRAQVLPAVGRTDRLAVARSHTTVGAALVGDADRRRPGPPCARARRVAGVEHDARHRGRVELDDPRRGRVGEELAMLFVVHGGVVAHDRGADRRRADVDDEQFHRGSGASGSVGQPDRAAQGSGRPSLPGLRMPFGSSAGLRGREHVEGGAERVAHEPGPVEADAVVVAQRAAVLEHRPRARVPRGAVVRAPARRRRAGPRT